MTNSMDAATIIFEIVVGLAVTGLVPWAYRVTRQLAEIDTTLKERQRQEAAIMSHDQRINAVELAIARLEAGKSS